MFICVTGTFRYINKVNTFQCTVHHVLTLQREEPACPTLVRRHTEMPPAAQTLGLAKQVGGTVQQLENTLHALSGLVFLGTKPATPGHEPNGNDA